MPKQLTQRDAAHVHVHTLLTSNLAPKLMSAAPGHGERAAPSGNSLHSRHRMPTAAGVRLERAAVRKIHEFMKLLGILSRESKVKARSDDFLKMDKMILNFNSKYGMS